MQPLIVYGMHRSGTSLMVRLLADLGLHMGSWLSRDAEAVHFQRLNRRIFQAGGSTWADVGNLVERMRSEAFVTQQVEATRRQLFGSPLPGMASPLARFFGHDLWAEVRCRAASGDGAPPWGWKDPRTTLTLPVWVRIFPQARYLSVLRNGIDVAISIHRRSRKQQAKLRNRVFPVDYSRATLDFETCFRLWEAYISSALEHRALIAPERHLEVRYEDLLAEPVAELRRITDWIGHPVSQERLEATSAQVERARHDGGEYAARYRDEIQGLRARPLMQQLGYGAVVTR